MEYHEAFLWVVQLVKTVMQELKPGSELQRCLKTVLRPS